MKRLKNEEEEEARVKAAKIVAADIKRIVSIALRTKPRKKRRNIKKTETDPDHLLVLIHDLAYPVNLK
jgi:hypothetical protein